VFPGHIRPENTVQYYFGDANECENGKSYYSFYEKRTETMAVVDTSK